MAQLIAILAFIAVSLGGFVVFSLLDERNSRARVLRDRLNASQETEQRKQVEDIALLRDEMLSEIPAFDSLLRRSDRVSALQKLLSQGDMKIRAGNFLLLCLAIGVVVSLIVYSASNKALIFAWVGFLLGCFLPYAYANYARTKRFNEFEELFPEAIDTIFSIRESASRCELACTVVSEPSWPVFMACNMSKASSPRTSPTTMRSGRIRRLLMTNCLCRTAPLPSMFGGRVSKRTTCSCLSCNSAASSMVTMRSLFGM